MSLVIVKDGTVTHGSWQNGLTEPSRGMINAINKGGELFTAVADRPPLNARTEMYGNFTLDFQPDKVVYAYPVIDKPIEQVRTGVQSEVDTETQTRIFAYFEVDNMTEALRKEVNAMSENETEKIDMLIAIRTAGKTLKTEVESLSFKELKDLNIPEWQGWPLEEYGSEVIDKILSKT